MTKGIIHLDVVNFRCQQPTCVHGALSLLKNGAGLQHFCGRSVHDNAVLELGECVFNGFDGLPSGAAIPHRKKLGAQIVEPQHVGVGVVVSPVVSEIAQPGTQHQLKKNKKYTGSSFSKFLINGLKKIK